MNDLVSIVIPTYNRPSELERCLRSVLEQTYGHFEVLVVNDGGMENELHQVINKLGDSRIRYLTNQRTKGANGARNTGVLNAKGKYVTFLDDDDEWYTQKMEKNVQKLESLDASFGAVISGLVVYQNHYWKTKVSNREEIYLKDILFYYFSIGSSSNLFFRRQVFDQVGLWDEELQRQQDLELMVRVLGSVRCAYQSEALLKVHGHNVPAPQKAFDNQLKYLEKIHPILHQFEKRYINRFYGRHFRYLTEYCIRLKQYKRAGNFMLKAFKHSVLFPKKDIKLMVLLFRTALS